jgi:hypothetical protein
MQDQRDGSEQFSPTRELMESFDMSHPIDQIDNSATMPLQMEHDGQMRPDRSQSDGPLENWESQAGQVLPNSLIANQRGPVTLLRLSRPAKRNALDDATIAGIEAFFSDPPEETRAIILHAEGKHFSAGVDLSSVTDTRAPTSVRRSRSWYRAFDRTALGMAMCRSSPYCTAPSSVAAWSLPLLHISGWPNAARTTLCQRPRAAYSLAAVVPCAYHA